MDTVNKILAIPLPLYNQNDELFWGPAADGNFSLGLFTSLVLVCFLFILSYVLCILSPS